MKQETRSLQTNCVTGPADVTHNKLKYNHLIDITKLYLFIKSCIIFNFNYFMF